MNRQTKKIGSARLITILGSLLLLLYILLSINFPYDRVELRVIRIPEGTKYIFPIYKTNANIKAFEWYEAKVFAFHFYTKDGPENWNASNLPSERIGSVQWIPAERYGLIARFQDGHWGVWWLDHTNLFGPTSFRLPFLTTKATIVVPELNKAKLLDKNQSKVMERNGWIKPLDVPE